MSTLVTCRLRDGRRGRSNVLAALAFVCAVLLLPPGLGSQPRAVLAQAPALEAYALVDVWPDKSRDAIGIFQRPTGLDVAADGRVYIADSAAGVHVMLPSGTFLPPFGASGDGPERLGAPGRLSVEHTDERVYVLDRATDRVVVYDLDGRYLAAWEDVPGVGISAGSDGRVYVADPERNQVRIFDRAGAEQAAFGSPGSEPGQFAMLTDLGVSPDGAVLAVGDLSGLRVQLFDLAAAGATFRRDYLLNHPRFDAPRNGTMELRRCRASLVHALGGDAVWVGDGPTGSCRIEGDGRDFTIATSAAAGTICKRTVVLPRVRPVTGQYVALATYDPNSGPCESARRGKDTREDTLGAVVQYVDAELRGVKAMWLAARDSGEDHGLLSPHAVTVPVSGTVSVQDTSLYTRFYTPDGTPIATSAMRTRWGKGVTRRLFLELAVGTDVPGEVFGYYHAEHWGRVTPEDPAQWIEHEHGLGRFRTVDQYEYEDTIRVIEPIWLDPFGEMSWERARLRKNPVDSIEVIDLDCDAATGRVVALVYERRAARRIEQPRLEIVPAGGVGPTERWDLPEDQTTRLPTNPHVDLDVGPDGRIYVLDDYSDRVLRFARDGTSLASIPVAADVRRIAGGSADRLFGLREPGYVERYAADGTVTARFDGRPAATVDPLTLTAIEADAAGRVFVADGRSSVIGVFLPATAAAPGARHAPADATCALWGDKAASPTRLPLGETTDVRLVVDGACGVGEEPSDILLVVLYYPRFGQVPALDALYPWADDPAAAVIRQLRRFVARVDLARHRIGVVSYWADTAVEQSLTHDVEAVQAAIRGVTRKWPVCRHRSRVSGPTQVICNLMPRIEAGMHTAQRQFDPASPRRRVMVLFQPDYCNRDLEYFDGECRGYPPAEEEARAIRDAGTRIVVYDGNRTSYRLFRFNGQPYIGDAQPLASSDADVVLDTAEAQHRMVAYRVPDELATGFTLVDEVADNMRLITGSVAPPATVVGREVRWDVPALPYGESGFALTLRPLQPGTWPTNRQAVATYTDGWGHAGRIVFPVPQVEVIAPTPVPEEPTPTPAPPTAQPTALPERLPVVYLPAALRDYWRPPSPTD